MLQSVSKEPQSLARVLIPCSVDIPSDDIRNIMSRLSRRPYITQEVPDSNGSLGGEYTDIGDVQEWVKWCY